MGLREWDDDAAHPLGRRAGNRPATRGGGRRGKSKSALRPDELRELWRSIGLLEIDAGELVVGTDYAEFDDFWWPFAPGVGGSGGYCASLDEAGREALRKEVRRRPGGPTGPFRLSARAWYVCGRRPGVH
jgi:hypothetical protein